MIIIELIKKRFEIRQVYKTGIGHSFSLLRYILPVILLILFLFIIDLLDLSKDDFKDLIKQINSLVRP